MDSSKGSGADSIKYGFQRVLHYLKNRALVIFKNNYKAFAINPACIVKHCQSQNDKGTN